MKIIDCNLNNLQSKKKLSNNKGNNKGNNEWINEWINEKNK